MLTKEDILRITSLPVKKMHVGNIVRDVVCDEVTRYIYYINSNTSGLYDRLDKKRTKYDLEKMKGLALEKEKAQTEQRKEDDELFTPPKIPDILKKRSKRRKNPGKQTM